jgi:CubicO group peptidase (beta-lactamase class C family)
MFSGAALATVGGSTVHEESTGSPVRTRFQVVSVAKQFVAVAALLLVERGDLALDQPVGRWFGHAPAAWRDITVHQLLTHTSGLGHWAELPDLATLRALDPDHCLRLVAETPLRTAPGTQWTYSGPGYLVLGDIVAKAAGTPYPRRPARSHGPG